MLLYHHVCAECDQPLSAKTAVFSQTLHFLWSSVRDFFDNRQYTTGIKV